MYGINIDPYLKFQKKKTAEKFITYTYFRSE